MELQLGRSLVRPWRPSDRAAIVKHANNRNVWINLRDRFPYPYTPGDADAWLHYAGRRRPPDHFAIEVDGEAVGGIGLELQDDVHRHSAEIGYWLGEEVWGRGIMTEAVTAFTQFGFATYRLCRIYALVFEWNLASSRVLEKAGFELEGRLRKSVAKAGRIIDQFLYARVRDLPEPPSPPEGGWTRIRLV